jgi:uncharacterized protein YkwD
MLTRRSGWIISILLLIFYSLPEGRSESPTSISQAKLPEVDRSLEDEMLTLTNFQRSLRALPTLIQDEALTTIAREHSMGMARQGFISHDLPSGGLESRMIRAGYRHMVVRENVATANSVSYAQNALLQSPPHQRNILAADVTRVGIGIVRCPSPCEKILYITEIFATPRETYQTTIFREILSNKFREMSAPDPVLEQLASSSVQSLNYPIKKEELKELLAVSAAELKKNGRTELSRVDINVQLLHDPNKLQLPDQISEKQSTSYGSGVRKVLDRNESAFLVLTLIGLKK